MNTRILMDHETVADGGFFARAVLIIEGSPPQTSSSSGSSRRPAASMAATNRLAAENVRVAVRPGADAEFIQMRHTFHSEGRGDMLTINVGDVYCLDRIRIRMDALVGPGVDGGEAEVGKLVVLARLSTESGAALETVELPLHVSRELGGRVVRAAVSRMPIGPAGAGRRSRQA